MNVAAHIPAPRDHNKPPLEESIVMEFDANLREHDFDVIGRIDEIEQKARDAGPCEDAETAGRYGETVKSAVAAARLIESEREALNRPILTAQRALMGKARSYTDRLTTAEKRIRGHLDVFAAAEKKRRDDAERERQRLIAVENARLAAIAEAERVRLQAIADAEAAQERARLQAIEHIRATAERARLQAIEDERAAAEAREVKVVAVEAKVVEVVAQVVEVDAAPVYEAPAAPVYDQIRSDRGVLVSSAENWHVEIENIRQVPNLYLTNPAVIEALRKVIAPSVRGKNGLREIKGCRIYPETKASVR